MGSDEIGKCKILGNGGGPVFWLPGPLYDPGPWYNLTLAPPLMGLGVNKGAKDKEISFPGYFPLPSTNRTASPQTVKPLLQRKAAAEFKIQPTLFSH